jgi:hypothetical protein
MKKLLLLLLLLTSTTYAIIPVTDVANLVNNQISHVENIAKWAQSIAQLKTQIDQLKQQVSFQKDLRQWTGNPLEAAGKVALEQLGADELLREYGRTRDAIIATADSLESLGYTMSGTYRALASTDLNGGTVQRDSLAHRRYAVLSAQQENYQQVFAETKNRERTLQSDLARTLVDLKNADTDAEVRKQTAKIEALNGQLSVVSGERHDQAEQVLLQKIANDTRLEQERIAAAELAAKDDTLAQQRVTTFMRTVQVRKTTP